MTYLLLLTAISLSAIAAYYSIMGLIAIFAAAAGPIAVMGGTLEVSKLVVASWLYRNWKETPLLMKSYFVSAVAVLMLLTSMGIFGFLSKAHMDQNLVSGDVMAKLSVIEEKLKIEKETIDAARKTLNQLDVQVNETIARTGTTDSTGKGSGASGATGIERSIAIRRSQAKERSEAQKAILSAQENIGKLNAEKAPIAAEVRKVEAEVGPIKYIAQLIYGEEATNQGALEQAVRWVIILIVIVFDPLAVLMFIAYNQSTRKRKEDVEPQEPIVEVETAKVDPQITDAVTVAPPEPEPIEKAPDEPKPSRTYSTINAIKKKLTPREYESEKVLIPVGGDNEKLLKESKDIIVRIS